MILKQVEDWPVIRIREFGFNSKLKSWNISAARKLGIIKFNFPLL